MLGLRADKGDIMAFDNLGKLGVFGQETIAGMDRIGMADFRRRDNRGDIQIAIGRRGWAYTNRFIRQSYVHRIGICRRMHRNGLDAHFMRSAVDTKRDFAAIGDQDFFDGHDLWLLDDHQRLAKLHRLPAFNEHRFHSAAIDRNDRVHNLHRLDNQQRVTN